MGTKAIIRSHSTYEDAYAFAQTSVCFLPARASSIITRRMFVIVTASRAVQKSQ